MNACCRSLRPTIKGHQYIANKLVNAIENP